MLIVANASTGAIRKGKKDYPICCLAEVVVAIEMTLCEAMRMRANTLEHC